MNCFRRRGPLAVRGPDATHRGPASLPSPEVAQRTRLTRLRRFLTDSEIGQIIQSAGRDFYLTAINIIEPGFESWGDVVKIIGTESEKKGKDLFMPLRASITGQMKGPELDKVVDLIGLERVIGKLKEASEI